MNDLCESVVEIYEYISSPILHALIYETRFPNASFKLVYSVSAA